MYILYHIVSPIDYVGVNMILMFAACEIRQCVSMIIVDDLEDEMIENILYTLERGPGLNPKIELDPVEGEIEILDNDGEYDISYNHCNITHAINHAPLL